MMMMLLHRLLLTAAVLLPACLGQPELTSFIDEPVPQVLYEPQIAQINVVPEAGMSSNARFVVFDAVHCSHSTVIVSPCMSLLFILYRLL